MALEATVVQLVLNGVLAGATYALIGSGMTLILGVMGIINVAHGAFYMLAAYVTILVTAALGMNPVFALPIAMGLMFLLGMATERIVVEPISKSVDAVLMAMFGLAYLLEGIVLILFGGQFRSLAPIIPGNSYVGDLYFRNQQALAGTASIMILIFIALLFSRTRLGLAIRSASEDRELSMVLGLNVTQVTVISFGIGVALVAAAGSLLSSLFPVYPASGWRPLLLAFVIVVLGGIGSIKGSLVAGIVYGLVESFVEFLFPRLTVISVLVVLIVIILIRPSGLFGKVVERL